MSEGESDWSVDVLQDELNKRCGLNWTWTVISESRVEKDEKDRDRLSFWNIVTAEEYSKETVREAVEEWLKKEGFEFDIEIIDPDEAEGSGLLEKIEELKGKDLDSLKYERLEELDE